ncbi:MAG: D-glycero-beta-D-manno-heptose 1-phosphate adenylyltransferase [Bacteroidota bacterium]
MWQSITNKISNWQKADDQIIKWKEKGLKVVFTNGCFDLVHYGHLHYLAAASALGDKLIVGLNSNASVKRLKGKHRPINDDLTREHLLASLQCVDLVVAFEEDTPLKLIELISPDVLVKGGDWEVKQIVGSDWVLSKGGSVQSLPFVEGYYTTNIEAKILERKLK